MFDPNPKRQRGAIIPKWGRSRPSLAFWVRIGEAPIRVNLRNLRISFSTSQLNLVQAPSVVTSTPFVGCIILR